MGVLSGMLLAFLVLMVILGVYLYAWVLYGCFLGLRDARRYHGSFRKMFSALRGSKHG